MKINERLIFRAVWILLGLTSCDKAERRHGQRGGVDPPPALPCAKEGEAAVKPPETRGKAGLRGCRLSRASQGTDPRQGTDPGRAPGEAGDSGRDGEAQHRVLPRGSRRLTGTWQPQPDTGGSRSPNPW